MHGCEMRKEALIRNLQDAGCPQAIIEQFMESRRGNDPPAGAVSFQSGGAGCLRASITGSINMMALMASFPTGQETPIQPVIRS